MKLRKLLSVGLFALAPTITFAQTTETQISFNADVSATTCSITSSHSALNLNDLSLDQIKELIDSGNSDGWSQQTQSEKIILTISHCSNSNEPVFSITERKKFKKLPNKLTTNDAATGIGLELTVLDNNTVKTYKNDVLKNSINLHENQIQNSERTLEISANYAKISPQVTPGKFETIATFVVDYK